MRMPKVSLASIVICGTLGAPGVALAQDPGIHFDSGSPAGKEYAIPLAEGRAEGAGTKNQRAAADVPFGVGITPPGGGDRSGGGGGPAGSGTTGGDPPRGESGGTKRSGAEARDTGDAADGRGSNRRAADEQAVSNAEAPVDTTGRTIGIALLVLAAGATLGLLLWRRRGQPAA
jgi:type IV secretion system protein TrbL